MNQWKRVLFAVLSIVLTSVGMGARPVSAHASLIASDPGYNAVLDELPATVMLEFNDVIEADLSHVTVIYGESELRYDRVESGPTTVVNFTARDRSTITWEGEATIRWRVYAFDGHTMQGAIPVFIGTAPPAPVAGGGGVSVAGSDTDAGWTVPWGWSDGQRLGRLGTHLAIVMFAAAWFWSQAGSGVHPRLRRPVSDIVDQLNRAAFVVLPTSVGLYGVATAADAWAVVDGARSAASVLVSGAVIGSVVVAGVAVAAYRAGWSAGPFVAAVAAVHLAGSSHAAEQSWPVLSVAAGSVHILAMAVWVGALVGFGALRFSHARHQPLLARYCYPALRRLGSVSAVAIAALSVTGVVQAWTISDGVFDGRWANVLGVKLLVAGLAVAPVAVGHHLALRSAHHGQRGWPTLRNSLLWELAALGVVIGMAVVVASTPQ